MVQENITKTHIIAEAGTNHNGDLATAKKLADVATSCGADSVKYQIINPEGLYLPELYESGEYKPNEVYQKRLERMLSDAEYLELAKYCQSNQLPISASVFDQKGLDLLDKMNPPYIKFASCDLNNSYLLKQGTEYGKPIILSTGMSTLMEIEVAVKDILATGHTDLVLMHCVSVYPCPTHLANLEFLRTLKKNFDLPLGFSDHTENNLAAIAAVGIGATWIEKHITLDRTSDGFDHAYAQEPDMFASYVQDIRAIEMAFPQNAINKLSEQEENVRKRARRGLFAARDIGEGEVVAEDDILCVRPETDLAPNDISLIIGRKSNQTIAKYQPLQQDYFS